jgi:hypothetical protein
MTDADLAASSHPLWPRWKGLVRFLRSSRGALPSAQPAARLLRTSHRLTRTLTDEADVQLDVSGSRFLLTRRIPDVEPNRFQWLIYVGDCSTSPATLQRRASANLWERFCAWITSTENRLYIGWFGVLMIPCLLTAQDRCAVSVTRP